MSWIEPPKAVVLLSGGMDSAVCLHLAKEEGFAVYALSLRYGQRHAGELIAAGELARRLPVARHLILDLDLRQMGGSALTDAIPVPKNGMVSGIPVTYVPARNTVMLSLALAWAETLAAQDLFIGVNAVDYSGYPDCRPEFIEAFVHMANLATRAGVNGRDFRVHTPLIQRSKAEIVQMGLELGVAFELTRTCYDPHENGDACGACDACRLRLAGFAQAGIVDPAPYCRPAAQ